MVTRDQSRFVRKSIEEVKLHLLLAAVLVSATILLFIRDWRTTVIATLAIPTSIVPTFLFMSFMGFTLNNITMLALILAIGIVIDDAVVVHENIFRHMEEDGMDAMEASRVGTSEIALAVLATSLSLVVIFLPIAFMGGIVGRFFSSVRDDVAFSVMMSLFVSFTLTPMLCSRFLKLEPGAAGHAKSKGGFIYRIVDGSYGGVLKLALRFKWLVVLLTVGVIWSTIPIGKVLQKGFIPRDDQSEFEVTVTTPEGYTLDRTDSTLREIEERLWKLQGVEHLFTTTGQVAGGREVKGEGNVTRGTIYVRLEDLEDRKDAYTQFEIQNRARAIMEDYPDLRASVNDVSAFQGGSRPQTFQVNLAGPDLPSSPSTPTVSSTTSGAKAGLADLDTTLSLRKPELQVAIDRERASDFGIPSGRSPTASESSSAAGPSPSSRTAASSTTSGSAPGPPTATRPGTSPTSACRRGPGRLIPLSNIGDISESRGPTEIERLGRERIVTVLGNPDGIELGDAVDRATAILDKMDLPKEYRYEFSGQAKTMGETGKYFVIAFGLSFLFMYLILAAQFESWTQPVAIMMALPVTIPFGLLSLVLFHSPMDIYAMFGLFMLVGIVKKNGILQVDSTNQLRALGNPRHEAIVEANHTRLRPILMTTAMLVAAMVPIALGQGPGAGARASMAKVIIGGQMLSLVLALIVTPVFYVLLDQWTSWLKRIGVRFAVEHRPKVEGLPAPPRAALEPAKLS